MNKPHFHNDLKFGQAAEQLLASIFAGLTLTDGRSGDFTDTEGNKVELKCDRYSMLKTPNFFIEHYGDLSAGKLGGPYKASKDDCKYFIYYYSIEGVGYVWQTSQLLEELAKLTLKPVEVVNKRWTTIGYKVPRALLEKFAIKFTKSGFTDQVIQSFLRDTL